MTEIMSKMTKKTLPLVTASLVAAMAVQAQEQPVPGLYTTVDESEIYVITRDGQQTDVKTGESVRINADGLSFVTDRPGFMNWPCGTGFAPNLGTLETYTLEDLPASDRIAQVVDRYFLEQQVPGQSPRWLNGEAHTAIPAAEIDQFVSNAFWYKSGPTSTKMQSLRPDTLLIGLFYGTGQVLVDGNQYASLKDRYGDDPIPVVFQFQEENVVPISYFGDVATPGQIAKAFKESGIKPADVPMWYAGDYHTQAAPGALADSLGVPPVGELDPDGQEKLREDLQQNGFRQKPVTLALVSGSEEIIVDEGERLRAAETLGITQVPVMFSVYDQNLFSSQCGLAPAIAAAGVLGTEEGEAPGATPPGDDSGQPPGGPAPNPDRPTPDPIAPPDPPDPEPPTSPN